MQSHMANCKNSVLKVGKKIISRTKDFGDLFVLLIVCFYFVFCKHAARFLILMATL